MKSILRYLAYTVGILSTFILGGIVFLVVSVQLFSPSILHYGIGVYHEFVAHNLPSAIEEYTTAIRIEPSFTTYYEFRANAKRRMQKNEEALLDAQKAVSLDPSNTKALFLKGFILGSLKKLQQSVDAFTVWVTVDPTDLYAYQYRGFAYGMLGAESHPRYYDLAAKDFTHVIQLDPRNGTAYFFRALVFGTKISLASKPIINSSHPDVVAFFKDMNLALKLLGNNPSNKRGCTEGYYVMSVLKAKLGDTKGADLAFSQAMTLNDFYAMRLKNDPRHKTMKGYYERRWKDIAKEWLSTD
ncbi:MAG: tetratricopeptide repeat protein [Vampirovibrionales bacterium]